MDPRQAGKILTELAKKARKNAGMNGLDLTDEPNSHSPFAEAE